MSAIFISHSSRDNVAATELRERLAEQEHNSIFLDFDPADGIPAGRNWEQELYARLRACRAVIVLCSEHSMASDWVFAEITHARALGKPVFPIKVAPTEIRSLLTDLQVLDLTGDREDGYRRLFRGLEIAGLDPKDIFEWDGRRPPFPGLLAFQEDDAAMFFGRDAEIRDALGLLRRLQGFGGARWTLVLGASGSGKSSLVRAGLLPRLRRDREAWLVVGPFRPLQRPLRELARALAGAFEQHGKPRAAASIERALEPAPDAPAAEGFLDLLDELRASADRPQAQVLLAIDQVEETLGGREEADGRFLNLLRAATDEPDSPLMILGTLRSDFLGDFQRHPALRNLAFENVTVGPMSSEGYAQVIEGPAKVAGVELEPGLVQAMVGDTETTDALPLLAFTLRELWERFGDDALLEVEEYRQRLGGLQGAVSGAAEMVMKDSPRASEGDLRRAFLSMVRVNDEGHYARAPLARDQLPERVQPLLERFVQARLLVARDDSLEVAHEALFRAWKKLASWLEDNREALRLKKDLHEAACQWAEQGRAEEYLWRGSRLSRAAEMHHHGRLHLAEDDVRFLDVSQQTERRAAEIRRRWRLGFWAAALIVTLAMTLLALQATRQQREATRERTKSLALLARSGQNRLDTDLLLAAAAFEDAPIEARTSLFALLVANPQLDVFLHGDRQLVGTVDVAPDGERVVSGSADGLRLWDRAGRLVASRGPPSEPMRVAFRSDGRVFAGHRHTGKVEVWHPDRQTVVEKCPVVAADGAAGCANLQVFSAAFDPAGKNLALGSRDGKVRIFALTGPARAFEVPAIVRRVGADGRLVVEHGVIADYSGLSEFPLAEGVVPREVAAGDRVVLRLESEQEPTPPRITGIRKLSADPGASFGRGLEQLMECSDDCHQGLVVAVTFSPDGRLLASGGLDGDVKIWDVGRRVLERSLPGHPRGARSLAFSLDGRRLAAGTGGGVVRLWQSGSWRPVAFSAAPHPDTVRAVAFRPDGRVLASGSVDGTLRLWNLPEPADSSSSELAGGEPSETDSPEDEPVLELGDIHGGVWSLAFSPDGEELVSGSRDGAVRRWNLAADPTAYELSGQDWELRAFTYSPDGLWAASGDVDGTVRLWDLASRTSKIEPTLVLPCHREDVNAMDFSPDGRLLAAGGEGDWVLVWDLEQRRGQPAPDCQAAADGEMVPGLVDRLPADRRVLAVALSSDHTTLAVADGDLRLFPLIGAGDSAAGDAETSPPAGESPAADRSVIDLAELGERPQDGSADVLSVAYHPREAVLALGLRGGVIELRSPLTLEPLSAGPLAAHGGGVQVLRFSPDGRYLASGGQDGTVQLWDAAAWRQAWPRPGRHEGLVRSLAFRDAEDGMSLASAGDDSALRLWDIDGGRGLLTLFGHHGLIYGIGFDRRGRLISGSGDRTLRRWDVGLQDTLKQEACRRANRSLSADEWATFIGGRCRDLCPELGLPAC